MVMSYISMQEVTFLWSDGGHITTVKISERKRAEEALQESEEQFRNAFEYAAIGMALVSPKSDLLKANGSLCQMLGYSQKELESMTWQDISHPDDLDTGIEQMSRMLTGEIDSCQFEKRYLHKRGHEVWAMLSFSLLRDSESKPLYFISQIQDITERKGVEEALRQSEERYRDLHENAPVAYFSVDLDGRISRANRFTAELLGYDTDTLVGRPVFDVYADTPAGKETAERIFERFRAGEDTRDVEVEFRRADGTSVWVSKTVRVIRDVRGEIVESRSWAVDISERKRMEEALQKSREELEGKVERQMLRRNPYRLTFRELTVLHLVGAGRSDKEIGFELGISPLTASKHVSNILAKMGAGSRTEATARALREGLLD